MTLVIKYNQYKKYWRNDIWVFVSYLMILWISNQLQNYCCAKNEVRQQLRIYSHLQKIHKGKSEKQIKVAGFQGDSEIFKNIK